MDTVTRIPQPFTALELSENGLQKTIRWLGGSVTFGANGLPVSMKAGETELLAAPVRFVTVEDGQDGEYDADYPANEGECFLQEHDDAHAILCGAWASERFLIATAAEVGYEGNITYSMKLAPRGRTVPQGFGLAAVKQLSYRLDRLWLEIPLKAEYARLYQLFPHTALHLADGSEIPRSNTSVAGELPSADASMSFKALCWLGDEERGFGFSSSSNALWQPEDPERVIEWVHDGDALILRVRMFDSPPKNWAPPYETGAYRFQPVCLDFGLRTTPVKPCPAVPLAHGLHIDCFRKTKGNYIDLLSGCDFDGMEGNTETGFDRIERLGVKTLILHEKWNKSQNFVSLSEYTRDQVRRIVSECHKRGIKVLTYFGYEYSLMAYDWAETGRNYTVRTTDGRMTGGWYRVPYQRAYVCCYNSDYAKRWVEGIARVMDECHTDGVYLDGTSRLWPCANEAHGCGARDVDGSLHPTYPIKAVHDLFEHLYREVHARGGIINVHSSSGAHNFTVLPFIDWLWCGEDLQVDYTHGNFGDVPLSYYRTMYTGRNCGVPVELIAYETRPTWNFENAPACSIIHGFLPRPNDIAGPLDLMSGIWKVYDGFPLDKAEWLPYWKNAGLLEVSDEKVKASFYRYTAPDGQRLYLLVCANVTKNDAEAVRLTLHDEVVSAQELPSGSGCPLTDGAVTADLAGYTCKIFYLRTK